MSIRTITFNTRDEYLRRNTAESIQKLLSNEHLGITRLLVNGDWGEGKTEFCHKMLNHLGTENYHLVYVDAFASDSTDNPILTLIAEISKLIPDEKTKRRFVQKVRPALKVGLKTASKAFFKWSLQQDAELINEEYEKEIQKGAEQLSDLAIDSALKDQVEAEKNIKALQGALELLTTGGEGKPLIICIDEFDRCRPPYAISMLETVKHVFDTKNVKFIFCANKEILEQSIRHHYGVEDAHRYLDKFIEFSVELPRAQLSAPGRSFEYSRVSIPHLIDELKKYNLNAISEFFIRQQANNKIILEALQRVPTFTLRDAEKLARNIAIFHEISDTPWDGDVEPYVSLLGIMAFTFYKTEFENLEKFEYSQGQILKHFVTYSSKMEVINDQTHMSIIFISLMSGAQEPDNNMFKFSNEDFNQAASIYGRLHFGNRDFKNISRGFAEAYRLLLNLSK